MSYHIYGLKNCNTTQKAIQWFKKHKLAYKFINNRTEPISKSKLELWCNQVSWEKLLNKKGTAFKLLHPAIQQSATTQEKAIEIMLARPSTIKRPLIEKDNKIITLGFSQVFFEIHYL